MTAPTPPTPAALTAEQIDALAALRDMASPGPWAAVEEEPRAIGGLGDETGCDVIAENLSETDRDLVIVMWNALPALIASARELAAAKVRGQQQCDHCGNPYLTTGTPGDIAMIHSLQNESAEYANKLDDARLALGDALAKLAAYESRDADARTCAEWIAPAVRRTVSEEQQTQLRMRAIGAAKRILAGEPSPTAPVFPAAEYWHTKHDSALAELARVRGLTVEAADIIRGLLGRVPRWHSAMPRIMDLLSRLDAKGGGQ